MNDLDIKIVVVLGSKPNSKFPDIAADVVLTANSAVEHALKYRNKYGSAVISMAPCNHLGDKDYIQDSISKSEPDELVILGGCISEVESFVRQKLELKNTKVNILNSHYVNWGLLDLLDLRKFVVLLISLFRRGLKYFVSNAVPDFFGKRDLDYLARSTGLNAILYVIERFKNVETIVITGVGLQEGGHFNKLGEFTDKTAKADRLVFSNWSLSRRRMMRTTDEQMNKIGHVTKWEGKYL